MSRRTQQPTPRQPPRRAATCTRTHATQRPAHDFERLGRYVDADGAAPAALDLSVPLVVGATAQEGDFAPIDDVRNLTAAGFAAYLRARLAPTLGEAFVEQLVALYVESPLPPATAFEAQRVYSELVADATVVCPNFYLAASWQAARGDASDVFAYRASQTLSAPFAVLVNDEWRPPYSPLYSFHASDMFPWLRPQYSADAFDYNFTAEDKAYGAFINAQYRAIVRDGAAPRGWARALPRGASSSSASPRSRDGLPDDFNASELKLPVTPVAELTDKVAACRLWLGGGFYETIGLIN
jgi:hypothetical protein